MPLSALNFKRLCQQAAEASTLAYAPYSQYQVGAAILCANNKIFTGCNVENSAYPVGICAEVNALSSAIAAGEKQFLAIAIATPNAGRPCGNCRQFMAEFGLDLHVICCDHQGTIHAQKPLHALLPDAFTFET